MNSVVKVVLRFMFSNVGLCILLIVYCCCGSVMYWKLESPAEEKRINQSKLEQKSIMERRANLRETIYKWREKQKIEQDRIANLSLEDNGDVSKAVILKYVQALEYTERRIRASIKHRLDEYHRNVSAILSSHKSFKGTLHFNSSVTQRHWTFPSSLIFTVTAVTVIGYGHIKPYTEISRFLTIPYCCVGIPLTMMFLANMGKTLAKAIRFGYRRVCCCHCSKIRRQNAARYNRRTPSQARGDVDGDPDEIWRVGIQIFEEEASDILQDRSAPVPLLLTMGIMVAYILAGATVYHLWEKWPFLTSLYCAFTTLTTIGFGDYVPGFTSLSTTQGKLKLVFGSVYIIIGLAVVSMGIDLMIEEVLLKLHKIAVSSGLIKEEKDKKTQEPTITKQSS